MTQNRYTLGIDIGSTTVKIAILDEEKNLLFSDYERHFANIQETLSSLLKKAHDALGELTVHPMITGVSITPCTVVKRPLFALPSLFIS